MSTNRYNRLKDAGLCVRCGKVPPKDGRVMCAECAQKNREAARANQYQRMREYDGMRKRYAKHREAGICVRCGKAPAAENRALCPECLIYMREYERKRNEKLRAQHVCVRCGAETDGRSQCDGCREWLRAYNREGQRRRRNERNL